MCLLELKHCHDPDLYLSVIIILIVNEMVFVWKYFLFNRFSKLLPKCLIIDNGKLINLIKIRLSVMSYLIRCENNFPYKFAQANENDYNNATVFDGQTSTL